MITASIRKRKRLEQLAVLKELKRSPGRVRTVNLIQNLLKPAAYLLFFYIGLPLSERIGTIGFVLVFVACSMLFDELIWRLLVIPALDKELKRGAEQNAAGQPATRLESK